MTDYITDTMALARDGSMVSQLRAALEAAEALQKAGIVPENAWRNTGHWYRLGRVALLAGAVADAAGAHFDGDADKWRERARLAKNFHVVK